MKEYTGYRGRGGARKWLAALLALIVAGLLAFAALEVYIGLHSRGKTVSADANPQVMVIFGCQMRRDGPSILLRDRLDTALAYWEEHPDMKIIVTGGKGDDEHISEPRGCMTTSPPMGWTGRRSSWRTSPGTPGRISTTPLP